VTAGVPHGVATCIVLPHAVRYNADAVAPLLALTGEAMGLERNGRSDVRRAHALAGHLDEFIRRLDQPRRLRDAGVPHDRLPLLAERLLESGAVRSNPRPLPDLHHAMTYLEGMW
jgi:alcohol dehydrogenase class IV